MALELAPTSVAVVGGDTIVGHTLELLLRSGDCNARYLAGSSFDEPKLLEGVQLLIIAPGLSAGCREAILALVESEPLAGRISVLELVSGGLEGYPEEKHSLLRWPCRVEELKRQINNALTTERRSGRDDEGVRAPREEAKYDQGLV